MHFLHYQSIPVQVLNKTYINCCMEAWLSSSTFNGLIRSTQAVFNFLGYITAVFAGVYFEDIVSTKFFGFVQSTLINIYMKHKQYDIQFIFKYLYSTSLFIRKITNEIWNVTLGKENHWRFLTEVIDAFNPLCFSNFK